jgi:hypothetical protein
MKKASTTLKCVVETFVLRPQRGPARDERPNGPALWDRPRGQGLGVAF